MVGAANTLMGEYGGCLECSCLVNGVSGCALPPPLLSAARAHVHTNTHDRTDMYAYKVTRRCRRLFQWPVYPTCLQTRPQSLSSFCLMFNFLIVVTATSDESINEKHPNHGSITVVRGDLGGGGASDDDSSSLDSRSDVAGAVISPMRALERDSSDSSLSSAAADTRAHDKYSMCVHRYPCHACTMLLYEMVCGVRHVCTRHACVGPVCM